MALNNLFGWNQETEAKTTAACSTACGAGEKSVEEAPAACGAADKPAEEKPAACGTACGAGDK